MKFQQQKNPKPIPVMLDETLRGRIEKLANLMGEKKSTVMRICMRVGLDSLEKVFEGPEKNFSSLISVLRQEGKTGEEGAAAAKKKRAAS